MKILDYLTFMSINDKKVPGYLQKLAVDTECEVFALESESVIAICDITKLGGLKSGDKYGMYVMGRWANKIVKTSQSKEELIEDYARLVVEGIVDLTRSSSSIDEKVKKTLKK